MASIYNFLVANAMYIAFRTAASDELYDSEPPHVDYGEAGPSADGLQNQNRHNSMALTCRHHHLCMTQH
jgi:hypothetical protein